MVRDVGDRLVKKNWACYAADQSGGRRGRTCAVLEVGRAGRVVQDASVRYNLVRSLKGYQRRTSDLKVSIGYGGQLSTGHINQHTRIVLRQLIDEHRAAEICRILGGIIGRVSR